MYYCLHIGMQRSNGNKSPVYITVQVTRETSNNIYTNCGLVDSVKNLLHTDSRKAAMENGGNRRSETNLNLPTPPISIIMRTRS
jgi:hypothetical protein